jgi:hypothetical protein|tara:strand:- start:1 stop:780 length:780 start_codon:yes stop_codon:yes gene_type:complete
VAEIPEIGVRSINVPTIFTSQPIPPPVLPAAPPVTSARYPIIDMPGCVRARINQGKGVETFDEDPRGVVTLCDGAAPVFEAADYRPRDFTWVQPPTAPIKRSERSTPTQSPLGATPALASGSPKVTTNDPPCPPFGAKAIGSFNKLGTKVLAGYELQDGKCVKIWDPVPVGQIVQNYVPDAGPTVSVALTAAFATTVAIFAKPIASVLQKLVKPLTKKVVKKINQKLGRKVEPESLQQRRAIQRHRNQAIRDLRRALGK